ncbi:FtsH protease activity modulator HflK [Pasteurella atlantica]|uniref:FtsH protease activity modulator HflK n=1 Tax=Pasteurellaceae TaxID=712 RepID=UPI00277A1319|nr:FtsH protease activity modulator HflK [Pasteurella atlantica]MDP8034441.1 FtsH protease activity modulator HflK [Pasteurella atlantica]MDP8036360.1 FtsH protease activity modulator HflK [Pasteurella atlantica]MDP8038314.1 FtsH protease activity modulator HflK [Pasteurella atlantica]MDP8048664.1 FtsH protease activity modulator HflK [Pasteurella atlantica]MDP8050633.1 FtsH protease activity modulator HflK [Pasteurella atlantica]
MSWNESGNQDPWGKPGDKKPENQQEPQKPKNDQQPPDLEEAFNNLLKKLGNFKGEGNNNQNNPVPQLTKLLPFVLGLGILVWAGSGFYTIKEAERGVVTRFGKVNDIVMPGLNWKPTFIDKVIPINIERVSELNTRGSMLTQDENMVSVEMTVQYRIDDPAKYLFSVVNPDDSLKQATDSALRYVIGHMTMDDILTTGRAVVREKTWKELREIIKTYDMGLLVTDVNFQYARPPEEVKDAFDDAIKAQEDEQRLIREAEAYARGQEPIARGNAQRILEQASGYKEKVVLNAKGETSRFTQLLSEYKLAPQIMKERLYLETMEKVMKNTPKLMMDDVKSNNLMVLPIDKLMNKSSLPEITESQTQQAVTLLPKNTKMVESKVATVPYSADEVREESSRKGRFE